MVPTLIVGGSEQAIALLARHLPAEGFDAIFVECGAEGVARAQRERFELVVLDMLLPDLAGTEVCRRLKADARTRSLPIVFVTKLDTEIDRVVAFELGAVDYVVEPFGLRELLLRLRVAVAHKASAGAGAGRPFVAAEALTLDFDARRARVGEADVALSPREFELLVALHARAGVVCARVELRDTVWGDVRVSLRTVDASVKRLRRKLGRAKHAIETVRGAGYRLRRSPLRHEPVEISPADGPQPSDRKMERRVS